MWALTWSGRASLQSGDQAELESLRNSCEVGRQQQAERTDNAGVLCRRKRAASRQLEEVGAAEDREGGGKGAKGKERGEGAAGEDQGLDRAAGSHSQREASQSTLHFVQIILAALHGQVGRYIRGTRWGSKGEAVPGITESNDSGVVQGYDHSCTDAISQLPGERRQVSPTVCPVPPRVYLGPLHSPAPSLFSQLPGEHC